MQPGDTTGDTKTAHVLLAETAKGNRSYTRAADHGTRFFNVPDLTSSVKRRLSARGRPRFVRSADRRGAGPKPGTVLRHRSSASMMRREHAVQLPVAARQAPSRPPRLL